MERNRSRPETGIPATDTSPRSMGRTPAMASTSSFCPLPSTPAIPRISPSAREKRIPLTDGSFRSSLTCRSFTLSMVFPVLADSLRGGATCRPTIISANWAGVDSATSTSSMRRPPLSTVTRSATAFTSLSLWVMKMIERPLSARFRRILISSPTSPGVRTAVGSSRIRSSASR